MSALRYENLIAPRLVDEAAAGEILKQVKLFRRCVEAGWIKPTPDRHACKLYALHQVHVCADLIEHGFYPGENDPDKPTLAAARKGALRPEYLVAA